MSNLNLCVFIGRMASEPELTYTPSGIAICKFRIAVNRPQSSEARKNKEESVADFLSIVCWRQTAEYAANYLSKGRLVNIEAKAQVEEYVDKDQNKRRDIKFHAERVQALDRPKESDGAPNGEPQYAAASSRSDRAPARAGASNQHQRNDELDDPFADN